jgi:hypothetical protein
MTAPRRLLIPETAWRATVGLLAPYAVAQVEAGVYWYGTRSEEAAVVSVVGVPRQLNRPRNFDVHSEDLAALIRRLPDPLVAVAALHTHPGIDTRHSEWDDARAVSRKILSLVLPFYGRGPQLEDAAVHQSVDGRWVMLGPAEARSRLALIPTLIDARS